MLQKSLPQTLFWSLRYGKSSIASSIVLIRRISKCTHCSGRSYIKRWNTTNLKELKEVIQFYQEDFDESLLRLQFLTFSINFQSTTERTPIPPCLWFVYTCKSCPLPWRLWSQIISLVKLVPVAAATNATNEGSFIAMQRETAGDRTTTAD